MMTLEQLLDNYRTYRDAFEVVMEQLQQADDEIEELREENGKQLDMINEVCDRRDELTINNRVLTNRLIDKNNENEKLVCENKKLTEKNDELLKRLIERDLESIKTARKVRELVKELAQYRGEDVK